MSKYTKNQDLNMAWMIDESDRTWTLGENATISVNGEAAIDVLLGSSGNKLKLLGDISATGDGSRGVLVSGVDTKIIVGQDALIEADEGIHGTVSGMRIVNKGEIHGVIDGISSNFSANIKNFGEISADTAITAFGASRVVNHGSGIIHGNDYGVVMAFGTDAVLINKGEISGDARAVAMSSAGDSRLVNTGTILGDIEFSGNNDVLDSRRGVIEGNVIGGDGNDVYRIGKNEIDIVENAGEGYDRVYSKTFHILDANVEALYLMGKKGTGGHGSDGDNFIHGSRGNDTLGGGAGDDAISSGHGDDVIIGGADEDLFIFKRGDDKDEINDFAIGQDQISLADFENIESFGELQSRMSQHGADTWISMGNGDRLILSNTNLGALGEDDFIFAV